MTVTYMGLDCVADVDDPEYTTLMNISQSGKLSWYYMPTYGYWVMYFCATLVGLAILRKVCYKYADWSYRNTRLGKPMIRISLLEKMSALSRSVAYRRIPLTLARITGLPATIGTLVLIVASLAFVLLVCFIPKYYLRPCLGFGSPPLAVRAGLMTMGMLPFLVVISGKTNFISMVTGISYEKLNIWHQYMAWLTLFLSLVHTVPFLLQPVREGGGHELRVQWDTNALYRNGVPPLVFLFLMCFMGLKYVRSLAYEIWWHSHWVLGLAYVGTLCWHIYGCLDSEHYIWGTLGFWIFQMLYRAVVKTTFKPNQYAFKSKLATLRSLPDDVFEVIVPIQGKHELEWKPGQHVFIRFMVGIHTLDNHPFSVVSTSSENQKSELKLLVKPSRGLTAKLYNMIQDGAKQMRCYIDGPYGGLNRDVLAFDKVVLVASGTGVSVTAPFLSHLADHLNVVTNCVQKVEFLWVVKSSDSISWIYNELATALEKAQHSELAELFDIKIFVTGSKEGITPQIISSRAQLLEPLEETPSPTGEKSTSGTEKSIEDHIKVYHNTKPDFSELLKETTVAPKTVFICSGTGSVQEACGNAVAHLQGEVMKGKAHEVYLHTENFGW